MRRSDWRIRAFSFCVATAFHLTLFLFIFSHELILSSISPEMSTIAPITLAFSTQEPVASTKPETLSEPEPEQEQKHRPEPALEAVSEPEPVTQPKPRSQQKPRLRPKPKPVVQTKKPVKVPALASITPKPGAKELEIVAPDPELLREQYLHRLMAHVDAFKFYPMKARRRGVKGTISIALTLLERGDITNLKVSGGHKLLRTAAERAVRHSLPLPHPPANLHLPTSLQFGIEYRLQ